MMEEFLKIEDVDAQDFLESNDESRKLSTREVKHILALCDTILAYDNNINCTYKISDRFICGKESIPLRTGIYKTEEGYWVTYDNNIDGESHNVECYTEVTPACVDTIQRIIKDKEKINQLLSHLRGNLEILNTEANERFIKKFAQYWGYTIVDNQMYK